MAARLFRLTAQYAVNIFFADQWDFNTATLFQQHSLWQIFQWQHGPHRQGLGGILAKLIEPAFHWNSRSEAFLATGLVVIAALCALYLKSRVYGSITWTDVAIPMLLFSLAQWGSLFGTVNLSYGVLPLLLIMLYCLAWAWRNEPAKFVLITVLNFVIIYTGFGLFAGFLTPVLLIAMYRMARDEPGSTKSYLVFCTLATLASLATFFVGYRYVPASGCPSLVPQSSIDYFWFVDIMYASTLGSRGIGILAKSVGGVVLAGIVTVTVISWKQIFGTRAKDHFRNLVPAMLGVFSILFCVATSLGRTCLGLGAAHASRYSNYTELGLLSLYFAALAFGRTGWRMALPAIVLISLLPSLLIPRTDIQAMQHLSRSKLGWRTCYLGGREIADCDREFGGVYPSPESTHLKEKLDFLKATHQNLFSDSP